jgi:hypothetical protein
MPEVTLGKEKMFRRGSKSFDKSAAPALTFPNVGIAQQAALSYLVNEPPDRQGVRILTAINTHSCRCNLRNQPRSAVKLPVYEYAPPFRSAATWPQDFLREGSQRTCRRSLAGDDRAEKMFVVFLIDASCCLMLLTWSATLTMRDLRPERGLKPWTR